MTFLSFSTLHIRQKFVNLQLEGARICIVIICCCCCCRFVVSSYALSFSSLLVSFISYQFCTCYIYLHIVYVLFARYLFVQLSSLRNISEHIVPWVSFFRLLVWSHSSCERPCLFRFVVFKYFHSYVVSYFMLIRVFVILLFSVTVFNNVSCQVY